MHSKIILWDNDGTIVGSKNPLDVTTQAKIVLPGVWQTMVNAKLNFIISGFKSPQSEAQNFNPDTIAERFVKLMGHLPISAAAFSPTIGGVACYVVIKKRNDISILEAHKLAQYSQYIGQFKKPDIGMFYVIKDIALAEFGELINHENSIMVGDTWHDEAAAKAFGIPFREARHIHNSSWPE